MDAEAAKYIGAGIACLGMGGAGKRNRGCRDLAVLGALDLSDRRGAPA